MSKIILSALLTGIFLNASSQQLNYTAKEAYAIHDSISKSRWDIGGRLSHYSFRFMSEFFPVAVINKPAVSYRFTEKPLKGIENIVVKKGKDSLRFEAYLQNLHINSFIVVHKGNIVFERYISMKPEDLHSLQSCTKVITSTLIAQLINEKKIDVNLPVETYVPALKNTDWQGTLVKHILNMRSGMKGSETSDNMGGFTNPRHLYYSFEEALGVLPVVDSVVPSVFDYVASIKRNLPAGQEPEYHSMNTFILGWILESVTGKTYAELVSERIWEPMGASSNAYVCLSNKAVPWAHGGLSTTLRDLARFGMLFTKSQITRDKEWNISFAQLKEIFDAPQLDLGFEKFQWGYQWDFAREGIMMKGGFGGQALYIDPEKELVIAYFNHVDKNWMINNMISSTALNEIRKAIAK
ncbi:MAG: beta-lactamase family protein [Chitinophagaceae bacterium]|nr:beta-lactamase family protein [Chitinophagaceae bacterium]